MGAVMEKRRTSGHKVMGVSLKSLSLATLTLQFAAFVLLLQHSRALPTSDGRKYLPSTAIFLAELLKLTICLTVSLYEVAASAPRSTSAMSLLTVLTNATFSGDSWKMALPAGLYTLANSLQFVAISNLDALTFHVLHQVKIVVVAAFCVTMLGRALSSRQWLCIISLMIGTALVSLPLNNIPALAASHQTRVYPARSTNPLRDHFIAAAAPGPHLAKRSATYEGIVEDEAELNPILDASTGLLAIIAVCVLSAWASVYFEKVIKTAHSTTSLWTRNVQISAYSLFPSFFIGILFLDGEQVAKYGFFAGYNWAVIASIMVQAVGGIITSFCLYYADNISKTFAVSMSMVLSSMVGFLFLDFGLTSQFFAGSAIILGATYVYSMQDSRAPTPSIRLITEESDKGLNLEPPSEKDVSIQIPKTPLSAEEKALSSSRPGSPALSKKRKGDQSSYFPKLHD